MLDHLNEKAWTELDRAGPSWTECKVANSEAGWGEGVIVSSPPSHLPPLLRSNFPFVLLK